MSLRTIKRRLLRRVGIIPPKYKSFVLGSAEHYDLLGRGQFELLRLFGLTENSYLLDIGCGSLSGGRFAIRFLSPGHYYGIEPEAWLIEEATRYELGRDLLEAKKPTFSHNRNFDLGVFGRRFDFVMAHSILTHASQSQIRVLLQEAATVLADSAIFLATYRRGESDYAGPEWVYPEGVRYRLECLQSLASEAGLRCAPVPWPHPRQSWLAFFHEDSSAAQERLVAVLGKTL